MATTQLENSLAWRRANYVDDSRVILLLRKRFEHHEVTLRLIVLDKVIGLDIARGRLSLHLQWVRSLADLTLECLPEEGLEVGGDLGLLASLQPG